MPSKSALKPIWPADAEEGLVCILEYAGMEEHRACIVGLDEDCDQPLVRRPNLKNWNVQLS